MCVDLAAGRCARGLELIAETERQLSMGMLAVPRRLGPPAMLVTLVAGIWMLAVLWGSQPWIHAAFAGLAVIGGLGGVVTRRGLSRVGQALQAEIGSELSPELRALQSRSGLLASLGCGSPSGSASWDS